MADYVSPEARRRIATGLMAAQYDRATPEEGNVTQRHGLLPLANYDNGKTGLAFPGFIADPLESWGRLLKNGYTPGDTQGVEDAFNVAGAAMMGGLAAPKPRGVVGSAGGDLKGAALGAIPDTPVVTGYRGSAYSGKVDGPAFWASSDPTLAGDYAKAHAKEARGRGSSGENITPAEFKFNNPMNIDASGETWANIPFRGNRELSDNIARIARDEGFDGLVINNLRDGVDSSASSAPQTTIAALQRGTVYSPLTGDLLYANGGRPGAATGAALGAIPDTPGIRAYHGSPHDFDKFDLSKIGTGEGAQAYGHGLYFAENEGVAKSYRDVLSSGFNGKVDDARSAAARSMEYHGGDKAKAIADLEQNAQNYAPRAELLREAQRMIDADQWKPGRMYEVNIKANPDDFLDWDKPLSQQSEKVRSAFGGAATAKAEAVAADLENVYASLGSATGANEASLIKRAHALEDELSKIDPSGAAQWKIDSLAKGPEMANRSREAGIPGIRYLDQGSRSNGQGSYNYVVFDANLIEILRKYGLLGMAGGAAAAEYGGNSLMPSRPASPQYRPGDA